MMANVITGIRILVSVALLFCSVFSPIFYAMYLIAGLSDMADGIVARKTNSVSEFGSRFDSIADFVFVAVCLIKILPVMDIPIWLYGWTAVIFFVKIINIISGYAMHKRFITVHTRRNQLSDTFRETSKTSINQGIQLFTIFEYINIRLKQYIKV